MEKADCQEGGISKNTTIVLIVLIVAVAIVAMTWMVKEVYAPSSSDDEIETEACLRPSLNDDEKAVSRYPWGKALNRGFVTRAEHDVLKGSQWIHKAELVDYRGLTVWTNVAIPIKKERDIYLRGVHPAKTISVVLMEDVGAIRSTIGLVIKTDVRYDPVYINSVEIDAAQMKVGEAFDVEWGRRK